MVISVMDEINKKKIGRYEIIRELGYGGMAVVYLVRDSQLDRVAALKLIRKQPFSFERSDMMMERFRREAKTLAKLNHPNIVNIYDYGEHEGAPYLVMEYLDGITLKDIQKPISVSAAIGLIRPIAKALDYVHQHGLLHRDVKSSNIMLTKDKRVVLTDFGIAKSTGSEGGRAALTETGVGIGTPEYMAPEQANGKTVDERADAYSLTVVFYELITGEKPYRGTTPIEVIIKQINDPIPDPRKLVHGLSKSVKLFLDRALAKNPENRFPTFAVYLSNLEKLQSESAAAEIGQIFKIQSVILSCDDRKILGGTRSTNSGKRKTKVGSVRTRKIKDQRQKRTIAVIAIALIAFSVFVIMQTGQRGSQLTPIVDNVSQTGNLRESVRNEMTESITAVPTLTKPAALATVLPSNLPLPAYPQTQITQIPDADSGNPYAKLKIGDRVWLGSYEQDNNLFNGTEPIEWTVIQVQDGTALLLSRYVLDEKKYDVLQSDDKIKVNWESSDLRDWLNSEFFKSSFTPTEKSFIQPVRIGQNDRPHSIMAIETDQDNYVFLLNWEEMGYAIGAGLFEDPVPTKYAMRNGAAQDDYGSTKWWLRSTNFSRGYQLTDNVCTIQKLGFYEEDFSDITCGVQPAVMLRLTNEMVSAHSEPSVSDPVLVGDIIQFGLYEQDESLEGPEPIDWRVLEISNGSALVLSEYALLRGTVDETCGPYTWKESSLRAWLNSTFYNDVFSGPEKSRIPLTHLDNWDASMAGSKSDFETDDRVFLLSPDEFERYLMGSSRSGKLTPSLQTEYSFIGVDNAVDWWLRTPGMILSGSYHVFPDGTLGNQCMSFCCDGFYFVRPATRILL